jgi:hypothetical protein
VIYLHDPKPGDKFRWADGVICRIIGVRDYGIQICFVYESGPRKGQWGYTLQPQDIEPYGVLDELANL